MDLMRGPLTIDADVVTEGHLTLALVYQALGRNADALACLDTLENLARQNGFPPSLITRVEAGRARLALMQEDLPKAVHWAGARSLHADDVPSYLLEREYLTLARVLIARMRDSSTGTGLGDVVALLDGLLGAAQGGGRMGSVIEILVLRALSLQAQHESGEALATLERALTLAEPEGYVRVFVDEGQPVADLLGGLLRKGRENQRDLHQIVPLDYARRLLTAFEPPHTGTTPAAPGEYPQGQEQSLLDLLTSREQEVLALIAEGLSNREIAVRLFIEIGTVKGYVHSLLRKLEVDNRTKAVVRARELHLLYE
jgi:LuxR family transcriptional regulator, maltose regulon positive regulatory protein